MRNILVTAGGTHENIDSVRSISNHATGRLGSMIADTFAQKNFQITYICSETAMIPTYENIEIIRIGNVASLAETMETLLIQRRFDCVVHTMAVSDFTPQALISLDEMIESVSNLLQMENISQNNISDMVRSAIYQSCSPLTDKKISSKTSDVALLLKQTPKIIGRIKTLQPKTILVGFKLLSNVSEKELLQAGENLLIQNNCDFVLANDFANIENGKHKAVLLDKNGVIDTADTKQDIAKIIFKYVSEGIGIK